MTRPCGSPASQEPDFRRIHDLLAECLRADPGNILYVDALLANLRRRQAAKQRGRWWKPWWNAWSTVFGRLKRKSESPAPERSDEPRTEHAVVATSHPLLTRVPTSFGLVASIPRCCKSWPRPPVIATLMKSSCAT